MRRPWQSFEHDALRVLIPAGFPLARLAAILRRTPEAVSRKARRLQARRPAGFPNPGWFGRRPGRPRHVVEP